MRVLTIAVCLVLGFSLSDQIPENEAALYSQTMVWLFVILLMSLTK